MVEASAQAWAEAEAAARRQVVAEEPVWPVWPTPSPPSSPVAERRSKSVHDPASRAEADARAAAEEAAGRGESGDHQSEADQTADLVEPPAADPADGAGHGDGVSRESEAAPGGGGAAPPSVEATPGSSRALVTAEPQTAGRSLRLRPAGSGTSAGSSVQPQPTWAACAGEATSGAPRSELDAAVDSLRLQIANHHRQWQSFAQAESGRLQQLERTFAVSSLILCGFLRLNSSFPFSTGLVAFQWGRASAPIGCSPRGPGRLRSRRVRPSQAFKC